MMTQRVMWRALVGVLAMCIIGSSVWGAEPSFKPKGISLSTVADFIHAVIEADRTLYTTHVVERMVEHKIVIAAETWKQRKALSLPAQMLLLSGLEGQRNGIRPAISPGKPQTHL